MRLMNKLNIKKKDLVSIVGAGGKTSVMLEIAKECKNKNLKVLLTTTTKIYYPQEDFIDNIILLDRDNMDLKNIKEGSITVIGKFLSKENKLIGLDEKFIDNLYKESIFDIIIVESDGAKRKTIKAPNYHEPVIPKLATKVIGVIGIDAIDSKANGENVHRIDEFLNITEIKKGEKINYKAIKKLVKSEKGLFKNTPNKAQKILILNKADDKELQNTAYELGEEILEKNRDLTIIIISIYNNYSRRCKL